MSRIMRKVKPPQWIPVPAEPERICLFCKHYSISLGSQGYSEMTPGSNFYMSCQKDHWRFEEYGSEAHYRGCLITAARCEDYEFDKSLLVQIKNK